MDNLDKTQGFIGVMDSGVGGISVLKSMVVSLPHEDFVYYGDSANAPYGEKSADEVRRLTFKIAHMLIEEGAKALAVACNTATSAGISTLRETYPDIPIIGVEPAIKPAALSTGQKSQVLVMATPITLRQKKYLRLADSLSDKADFISVPCPGLAGRIEQGNLESKDLTEMLQDLIGKYRGKADCVVLGCTHYPFIKKQIRQVIGDLPLFDGNEGTAKELSRRLREAGLLNSKAEEGRIIFRSSRDTETEIGLYKKFFNLAI